MGLYTTNSIKTWGLIPSTLEDRYITPLFSLVDKIHIKPLLGKALYTEILNQANTNNLTQDNKDLLAEMKDLYCYCIAYQGIQTWSNRIMKLGMGSANNGSFEKGSEGEVVDYSLKMLNFVKTLEGSMQEWLEDNKETYPLYPSNSCSVKKTNITGGFYLE